MSAAAVSQAQSPAGDATAADEPNIAYAGRNFLPITRTITDETETTVSHGSLSSSSSSSGSASDTSSVSGSGSGSGSGAFRSSVRRYRPSPGESETPENVSRCIDAIQSGNDAELARIARTHGLPSSLRAQAWPLLLPLHPFVLQPSLPVVETPPRQGTRTSSNGSQRRSHTRTNKDENTRVQKRITGELRRLRKRMSTAGSNTSSSQSSPTSSDDESAEDGEKEVFASIHSAVSSFLVKWAGRAKYEPSMVWTAYFLTMIGIKRQDLTPSFEHIMLIFGHDSAVDDGDVSQCISHFIGKLRYVCPDIAAHFDSEDVLNSIGGDEWLSWWIKSFGAKAFAPEDTVRLWDMYIGYRLSGANEHANAEVRWPGNPEPRCQHMYVCLAMMKALRGKLLELDQSEIRQLLSHVPFSKDPELLIAESEALWEQHSC